MKVPSGEYSVALLQDLDECKPHLVGSIAQRLVQDNAAVHPNAAFAVAVQGTKKE